MWLTLWPCSRCEAVFFHLNTITQPKLDAAEAQGGQEAKKGRNLIFECQAQATGVVTFYYYYFNTWPHSVIGEYLWQESKRTVPEMDVSKRSQETRCSNIFPHRHVIFSMHTQQDYFRRNTKTTAQQQQKNNCLSRIVAAPSNACMFLLKSKGT